MIKALLEYSLNMRVLVVLNSKGVVYLKVKGNKKEALGKLLASHHAVLRKRKILLYTTRQDLPTLP
jgi:hypothetical protein